jgi:hypothetical protein
MEKMQGMEDGTVSIQIMIERKEEKKSVTISFLFSISFIFKRYLPIKLIEDISVG